MTKNFERKTLCDICQVGGKKCSAKFSATQRFQGVGPVPQTSLSMIKLQLQEKPCKFPKQGTGCLNIGHIDYRILLWRVTTLTTSGLLTRDVLVLECSGAFMTTPPFVDDVEAFDVPLLHPLCSVWSSASWFNIDYWCITVLLTFV